MDQLTPQILDPIMTIPEVSRYLKISRSKAYYMAYRKVFPILRLGKNIRVRASDLQQWINRQIEKAV